MPILLIEQQGRLRAGRIGGRVLIGRRLTHGVVVPDAAVSRLHAWIDFHDGEYVLTDAGSRTGTFVNGIAIARHELQDGDEVRVGPATIFFRDGEQLPSDAEQVALCSPTAALQTTKQGFLFDCVHCGAPLWVAANLAGRRGLCKYCGESVRVPPSPPIEPAAWDDSPNPLLSEPPPGEASDEQEPEYEVTSTDTSGAPAVAHLHATDPLVAESLPSPTPHLRETRPTMVEVRKAEPRTTEPGSPQPMVAELRPSDPLSGELLAEDSLDRHPPGGFDDNGSLASADETQPHGASARAPVPDAFADPAGGDADDEAVSSPTLKRSTVNRGSNGDLEKESATAVATATATVVAPAPPRRQRPAAPSLRRQTCGICHASVDPGEETTTCPDCSTTYHTDCWMENYGCATYGCPQVNALKPASVIEAEAQAAAAMAEAAEVPVADADESAPVPVELLLLAASVIASLFGALMFGIPPLAVGITAGLMMLIRKHPRRGILAATLLIALLGTLIGLGVSDFWYLNGQHLGPLARLGVKLP